MNSSGTDIRRAKRPKLLLLAWSFPPAPVMGAVRTWNIAKHLVRLGWDVTVVTPRPELIRHPDNAEEVKAGIKGEGIRQIVTDHRFRFLDPGRLVCRNQGLGWLFGGICRRIVLSLGISRGIGWIKAAERACRKLSPDDVDLILASGPPFSPFVLAERISKRLKRPYVLDYRDPWWTEVTSIIHMLRPVVNRLEARLLAGCAAVTIVSPSWASDLDAQFKIGSKVHVITNGYDPEDLAEVEPLNFGHFAIVYAGIFYPPERVITPVLAALKRLTTRASGEWYFHYYGPDESVREEAVRIGVSQRVKLHGRVPRAEALSAVRGANIAVVITSVFKEPSVGIRGWIPAKLFETIGLRTPILLIAPPGGDIEPIAESTGLARRFAADEIDGMASFIGEIMSGSRPKQRLVQSITWKCIASVFDRVLGEAVARFQTNDSSGLTGLVHQSDGSSNSNWK